jgi:hypothetical protein
MHCIHMPGAKKAGRLPSTIWAGRSCSLHDLPCGISCSHASTSQASFSTSVVCSELEYPPHDWNVAQASDDQEREEEKEDEEDDSEPPIGVIVDTCRRHLIARADRLLDVLKAQRLGAE